MYTESLIRSSKGRYPPLLLVIIKFLMNVIEDQVSSIRYILQYKKIVKHGYGNLNQIFSDFENNLVLNNFDFSVVYVSGDVVDNNVIKYSTSNLKDWIGKNKIPFKKKFPLENEKILFKKKISFKKFIAKFLKFFRLHNRRSSEPISRHINPTSLLRFPWFILDPRQLHRSSINGKKHEINGLPHKRRISKKCIFGLTGQ